MRVIRSRLMTIIGMLYRKQINIVVTDAAKA